MRRVVWPVALTLLMLTGCAGTASTPPGASPQPSPAADTATPATSPIETADDRKVALEAVFAQLPEEFLFASGACGWSTILSIEADGSFTGQYHDSEMGGTSPLCYLCTFSGTLSQPEWVDEYTYSTKLLSLEQDEPEGEEYTEGGVHYIISTPYGMEGAEELLLYRPGTPVSELPEEFCNWTGLSGTETPETLPFWGLYNVSMQQGWAGYEGD